MMNNRTIVSFVLVLGVLSCQKEAERADRTVSDEMGEVLVDAASSETKCISHGNQTLFEDMPYVTASGDTIYISASISDMVDTEIEHTKAAPITSATAIPGGKFYTYVYEDSGQYTSVANASGCTDAEMSEVPITYASSKWSFDKTYFWPTPSSKTLHFVSFGPANLIDDDYIYNLTASGYGWNSSAKTLKGRYQSRKDDTTTKNDAVNLHDFIYGYDNQSKQSHDSSVEINLKHACVGVKFQVGNIFGTIGTVSLSNFYRNADFTISSTGLTWSNWGFKTEFKQEFNKKVDNSNINSGESLDGTTGETKTFIIIPQELPADAAMIIDMANTLHPDELSFDKICTANPTLSRNWVNYQGKIITFRISSEKANHVSVAFSDTVTGKVKHDLKFENDGKSAIYMRAVLVGNWLNVDGKVLTSWQETGVESKDHGLFTSDNGFPNLPATAAAASTAGSNWVKGTDGFYYYTKILESGHTASQPLFKTFTVTSKPADNEGNWNTTGSSDESMQIARFEMAILVQAVSAEESGTGKLTKVYAQTAWGNAVDAYLTTTSE